jgi:hypothetical protein
MKIEKIETAAGIVKLVNTERSPVITDAQSALDLIATVRYEHGAARIIIDKSDVAEEFFDLKTRLAGEVLQKFANYRMAVAIVGDYSKYKSKSLRDFIYESNKGSTVFFVPDIETAVAKLGGGSL